MQQTLRRALGSVGALSATALLTLTGLAAPAAAEDLPHNATESAQVTEAEIQNIVPELNNADQGELADWYGKLNSDAGLPSDFYQTPESLPAKNGAIVKTAPMTFNIDPNNVITGPAAKATKVMYKSTNFRGQPVAVTGAVLESKVAWTGPGERPVISFAPGTQGLGDSCAPSYQLEKGTEYEFIALTALLNSGYNVVVTDYVGSGTQGTHSYLNRVDQGNAVLDAARVAQGAGIATATAPVGLWGYSQGGGAVASAGELQATYAPELNVKGIVAGASPADLQAVMDNIDGTLYNGFMLMGLAGLGDSYGIDYSKYLTPQGQEAVSQIRTMCTGEAISAFGSVKNTGAYTLAGQPLSTVIKNNPELTQLLRENSLAAEGRHPQVPILINSSWGDDVIPHATNRKLGQAYCRAGSDVSFYSPMTPTHAGAALAVIPRGLTFMDRRFKGLWQSDDCWLVGA